MDIKDIDTNRRGRKKAQNELQVGNHSQSMTNMELAKQENEFLGMGDPNLTDRQTDKSLKKSN